MFSCSLTYPKLSAKNIYYCGLKAGETNTAHMVSNEVSRDLNTKSEFLFKNLDSFIIGLIWTH